MGYEAGLSRGAIDARRHRPRRRRRPAPGRGPSRCGERGAVPVLAMQVREVPGTRGGCIARGPWTCRFSRCKCGECPALEVVASREHDASARSARHSRWLHRTYAPALVHAREVNRRGRRRGRLRATGSWTKRWTVRGVTCSRSAISTRRSAGAATCTAASTRRHHLDRPPPEVDEAARRRSALGKDGEVGHGHVQTDPEQREEPAALDPRKSARTCCTVNAPITRSPSRSGRLPPAFGGRGRRAIVGPRGGRSGAARTASLSGSPKAMEPDQTGGPAELDVSVRSRFLSHRTR